MTSTTSLQRSPLCLDELMRAMLDYHGDWILTPQELDLIDPTHKAREKWYALSKRTALSPNPIRLGWRCPRKPWPDVLADILFQDDQRAEHLSRYEVEMLQKVGPQGGGIEFNSILRGIASMFSQPAISIPDSVRGALGWFLRQLDYLISWFGIAQPLEPVLVPTTSAGFPFFTKKGSATTSHLLGEWASHWTIFPDMVGTRYMRKKQRVIHNDAVANVYVTSGILASVRHWLRTYMPQYFSTWLNPYAVLYPSLTKEMTRQSVWYYSFDYDHMDEHVSWALVSEIVCPIFSRLLPPWEADLLRYYLEMGFREPVFMGDRMRCGLHGLLSGQPWTNDVETIISVIVAISLAIETGVDPSELHIYALGDDLGVVTRHSDLTPAFLRIANALGLESNAEKQEVADDHFRFLRRTYERGIPFVPSRLFPWETVMIGGYPRPLTYNSIINPEYMPDTQDAGMVGALQICDVLYGSPRWSNFVTRMWGNLAKSDRDFDPTVSLSYSWWERVTGDLWHYATSPTYQLLIKQGILIPRG